MILPTVAIIGRPNVGKSSLFNRILRRRFAVVEETPGVTRDRNYADTDWVGKYFRLVDTGGIDTGSKKMMDMLIADQSQFAIHESDLVIFLVDCQTGVDDVDRDIARQLSKSGKPTILVANKADTEEQELEIYEFMKLGLGDPIPVSALSGRGIGDLLDIVVNHLPDQDEPEEDDAIRVAVVGRPNVGKSSFINMLVGDTRLLVTPMAGTTRDAVDTRFEFNDKKYILVDTAGLRRKYKVHENIEFYTTLRTSRAIDGCDVAVILIDAQEGMMTQDQRVLTQVLSKRKAAVLVVNKWDLIEKDSFTADKFTIEIKSTLAKFNFLPLIYTSALTGQRVEKVLSLVDLVYQESCKRIPTPELNKFMEAAINKQHPPSKQGKQIKFYYVTQSEIQPPTFIFFTNQPKFIAKTYISYLSNQIREKFGFIGVPFRLKFQRK